MGLQAVWLMSSGLDFGALSLGVARFVLCGSSSQLYRAVSALFLTGISQSELSFPSPGRIYHGEQSGVHQAGVQWDLGLGLVLDCL